MRAIDMPVLKWAAGRGISRATLELLRVASAIGVIPELGPGKRECIVFPYPNDGYKARALDDKGFISKKGMQATFWGLDDCLADLRSDGTVWIVEGEMDRCALVEVGLDASEVIAAPGAAQATDTKQGRSYEYISKALVAGLAKAKKFVLATDQDSTGLELRKALARILGPARCWFIDWPTGIKDANEFLLKRGAKALEQFLAAEPRVWPVQGMFRVDELPKEPELKILSPTYERLKDRISFAAPGFSVVTGQPGHGKTQLMAQLWFDLARKYDLVIAIATFETRPKPYYQRILRQLHAGKPLIAMSAEEVVAADAWIRQHYIFFLHEEERPTLEWLLSLSEVAAVRHTAKVVVVDPWNRLEADRDPRQSETDYIATCLRSIYIFAREFGVHFQILAHPSKSGSETRGKPPELQDIAGSKHWDNMPDQGMCVWRPRLYDDAGNKLTYAELHYLKARFPALGYPTKIGLNFDPDAGRYGFCDPEQPQPKNKPKKSAE